MQTENLCGGVEDHDVLLIRIVAWYSKLTVQLRSLIAGLVQTAMKIMGVRSYPSLQVLYEWSVIGHAQKIVSDLTYILHWEFQLWGQ